MQESVYVNRGFQLLNSFHIGHQIKCMTQQASDAVAVFYMIGSENVTNVCPYQQHEPLHKYSLGEGVSGLIYNKKYRLYVAACPDLTIRIFNEHFELIDTVHVTATVLCLSFNEATSELYTGGVGCINTWKLRHQLHNPLILCKPIPCSIQKDQWVISLHFDVDSEKLVATCQDAVYILDTRTCKQICMFANTHRSSLTSAVLFDSLEYLISGAKDGSIKVWNTILHYEVHTFSGHMKAVTGLKAHPSAPCVISCSLDGSIRTWHLENMTECYRVDCGEGILGMCSDFPVGNKLACYSCHEVRMWAVDQLESHFTTINSHVLSMFRVSMPCGQGLAARIVALAEDGGLRLLSPVSGQIITIIFPMFSSQLLHESDVVYSLCDGLIFVLLKTSDVLVFSANTNPCSAKELWVPNKRNKINCIAMCSVYREDGTIQSVVFAGQQNGDITLLYSHHSQVTMPLPCPAHDGHVIQLVGSGDPIDVIDNDKQSNDKSSMQCTLLSFGTDNILNAWTMELNKGSNVLLKLLFSINIGPGPIHMCLVDSIICMALDSSVVMIDLSQNLYQDSRLVPASLSLKDLSTLSHQTEDDHTDTVISLQGSPQLKLFATSSRDGHVKIWNNGNQLISELEFGDTLGSACFANVKGDLLVGFQNHVCVVRAEDYLLSDYVDAARVSPFSDVEEKPITFDSELEFWYDNTRVPSLPAEQEIRDQHLADCNQMRYRLDTVKTVISKDNSSFHGKTSSGCQISEEDLMAIAASAEQLQSMMDKELVQSLSQQYIQEHGGMEKKVVPDIQQSKMSLCVSDAHSHHSLNIVSSMTSTSTSKVSGYSSLSHPHLSHSAVSLQLSGNTSVVPSPPAAEVALLQSPSTKVPLAPDCLIPNSVLRAKIGYVPPVVIPPIYKPPCLRHKVTLASSDQTLTSQDSEYSLTYFYETDQEESCSDVTLADEGNGNVVTCVSGFGESEQQEQEQKEILKHRRKSRRYSRKQSKMLQPSNLRSSTRGGKEYQSGLQNGQRQALSGTLSRLSNDSGEDRYISTPDLLSETISSDGLSSRINTSKINIEAQVNRRRGSSISKDTPSYKDALLSSSDSRRDSLASVIIPGPGAVNLEDRRSRSNKRRRSSSVRRSSMLQEGKTPGQAQTEGVRKYSVSRGATGQGLPVLTEMDGIQLCALKICSKPWFPKQTMKGASTRSLDEVFSELMELLTVTHMPVFGEVCRSLLELKKERALSGEQEMMFALELVRVDQRDTPKTASTHSLRLEILKTLKRLGLGSKEVLYAILPLLTDTNLEIRKAAFGALGSITGIVKRTQLHELLVDLGLLQIVDVDEDDVISDLAVRVRNGSVKVPPNGSFATNRLLKNHEQLFLDESLSSHQQTEHSSYTHLNRFPLDDNTSTTALKQVGFLNSHKPRYSLLPIDPGLNKDHMSKRRGTYFGTISEEKESVDNGYRHVHRRAYNGLTHTGQRPVDRGLGNSSKYPVELQRLMIHHPNSFSQTSHAMRMMLTTYGKLERVTDSSRGKQSPDGQDYKWSDIFPVIKASFNKQDLIRQALPTGNATPLTINSKQIEPATCEHIANTMTRALYQRFTNTNRQSMKIQKSSSKCKKELEEVKKQSKEQSLVVKLPKLTCN